MILSSLSYGETDGGVWPPKCDMDLHAWQPVVLCTRDRHVVMSIATLLFFPFWDCLTRDLVSTCISRSRRQYMIPRAFAGVHYFPWTDFPRRYRNSTSLSLSFDLELDACWQWDEANATLDPLFRVFRCRSSSNKSATSSCDETVGLLFDAPKNDVV